MSGQTTLAEISADTTTETPNPETHAELIEAAKEHAGEVVAEHYPNIDVGEIKWSVSTKATKRAGACRKTAKGVEIRLTWPAYVEFGWEEFSETIRHELIHAKDFLMTGQASHGTSFKIEAEKLDTHVHCRRFSEPKYWVYCTGDGCDSKVGRQKRSKTVKQPEKYTCQDCGSEFAAKKNPDHPDH